MITGNYFNKYASKNPAIRFAVNRFKQTLLRLVQSCAPAKQLDVGCGEGYLMDFIVRSRPVQIVGVDITQEIIDTAKKTHPHLDVRVGSAYDLEFDDDSFDLVTMNEVLEHLERPEAALGEVRRVTRKYAVFSVPHEPYWRMLNFARLKYVKDLGNTPGHLNHWSKKTFEEMLRKHFSKVEVVSSMPWIFAKCEK